MLEGKSKRGVYVGIVCIICCVVVSIVAIMIATYTVGQNDKMSTKSRVINGNIEFTDYAGNVIINKYDISNAQIISSNEEFGIEITFTKSGREKFASETEKIANEYSENGLNCLVVLIDDEPLYHRPFVGKKLDVKTLTISISKTEDADIIEKIYGKK